MNERAVTLAFYHMKDDLAPAPGNVAVPSHALPMLN
jgi:hypothetical protein